jgi:precorrin-2/cobalt-factor-2 C20-methyltransferase
MEPINMKNKPEFNKAQPGHFYAVGVGPGSPDLLTYRAATLIETADVVIAPRSCKSDKSLALQTVKHLIDAQEVVDHVYAMQRDIQLTMDIWREMADLSAQRCQAGKSVVQITLGDPLIYSTSCYLMDLLKARLPAENVHVIPGISAFQASASLFGEALTIQEDRMMLMPATDLTRVEEALDHCETMVLYKAGRKIGELADLLESRGLLDSARLVCYAEQAGREFVSYNLREAANGAHGYMATVIINIGRQAWADTNE